MAISMERLKTFYNECIRVIRVTKKPDRQEFTTIVKVSGTGMLAMGLIGFIISMIATFIKGGF